MSNKINSILALKGIGKGEFAKKLGMSESNLWKKLNGMVTISLMDVIKISKELDLTNDQVIEFFLPDLMRDTHSESTTHADNAI